MTEEFKQGWQYSTVNSYCSTLSAALFLIDGYSVGHHPVCKLLQGMFLELLSMKEFGAYLQFCNL